MENQTIETLMNRYSCRNFKTDMISDSDIDIITKAAVASPSAVNNQPWRVVVVKNKAVMDEIEAAGIEELKKDNAAFERIMSRGGTLFYHAPTMIVLPIAKGAALDGGIICQNIVIAAESLGISTLICGLAGLAFNSEKGAEFKAKLQFPEGYEFGIAILLGYPAEKREPHILDMGKIITIT